MTRKSSPARMFLIMGIVFLVVGLGLLIAGGAVTATRVPESRRVYVPATIVRIETYEDSDGDTDHDVYVSYEAEGQQFERELNFYSSSYHKGKVIEVYYEVGYPGKIHVKAGDLVMQIVLFACGAVFALVGFWLLRSLRRGGSRKLMESGTLIQTEYVETRNGITVNDRPTYYIVSRWNDYESGKEYSFKSSALWQNPAPVLAEQGVRNIPVYIRPGNPKQYYMDLSGIQGLYLDA